MCVYIYTYVYLCMCIYYTHIKCNMSWSLGIAFIACMTLSKSPTCSGHQPPKMRALKPLPDQKLSL